MGTTFEALSRNPEQPPRHDRARCVPRSTRASTASGCSGRSCATRRACRARAASRWPTEIERSLPLVSDAFEVGAPVQAKAPTLYRNTDERVQRARRPGGQPQHAARRSRTCAARCEVATPLVEYVSPYQTRLQLLDLLADRPRRARVRERARRHRPAQRLEVRQQHPGQPRQRHRGRPPGGRARWARIPRPPRTRTGADLQALHNGAYVIGDRRPGQRRLRGRPARLRDRARACRTAAIRPRPTRPRAAAATWCSRLPPRPLRRHLQGARARHRQPRGRALMAASPTSRGAPRARA